jgi:predicted metal-dependent enzyme (double-stranded beta helix superfamily)
MGYTLSELAADIRRELGADSTPAAKAAVCGLVARALKDEEFVATHLKERPAGSGPREVLYEDPELGFCICGHVYPTKAIGSPHDHGSSWAIYGVAIGDTEMVDWRIVKRGEGEEPILVEPEKKYLMKPGDSHLYDVGAVHSPNRRGVTKLVRIEGKNLDNVKRSNIKAA